jgi:4-hydroxy-tetrahydrodipicolinate synthase
MYSGSIVALVTPMSEGGALDLGALDALVEWHVEAGTAAIAPVGTTGESPTVTMAENCALIERVVRAANGRVPVIAGTGANATAEALELTRSARESGADAAMLVAPYYNRPTQEGLRRHYLTVADAVDMPLLLYNVPPRTASDLQPETVVALSRHPNIVGIKDASGDASRVHRILDHADEGFCFLSGEDALTRTLMHLGAHGTVSVTANVVPERMAAFCAAMAALGEQGAAERARALDAELQPLHAALFCETSPSPVKWALHRMGRIPPGIRLPLLPLSEAQRPRLESVLRDLGVL